jgi:peptidoglycan/xylan/chitin deacetylase (PgdA/CDA1 family)
VRVRPTADELSVQRGTGSLLHLNSSRPSRIRPIASRHAVAALAIALALAAAAGAAPAEAYTVVSLEFDDGTSDQRAAIPMLAARGLRATFFLNSGRIDRRGYWTTTELRSAQAAGHEIGGHTIDHVRLIPLDSVAARGQVCDDHAALRQRSLAGVSFSYPFGAYKRSLEAIVRQCGYLSARTASCPQLTRPRDRCPYAERLPLIRRFATRTPDTVEVPLSTAKIVSAVLAAERRGGGWVQVLFHRICPGCHPYSISAAQTRAVINWLARWARERPGRAVRTVRQVTSPGPRATLPGLGPSELGLGPS